MVCTDHRRRFQAITGAPRVFNGKVVIGNSGGDFGDRGYVTAYDVDTGKQVWRFYTVPGNPADGFENEAMEMAANTWRGEWWKTGTGGTVWDGMTYDPELNRLYIGTGNSGPFNPETRSPGGGDNLFLTSIVAVDADSGRYIWHYQLNPREAWDYKATAEIVLADLAINGRQRKVLLQAPTNGFFYVIDRLSGELLSAEKIGKVTWAERIDLNTGRPVETENIRYQNGPVTIWPSILGSHNWQPMSYSPLTGLVYIPYMQLGATFDIDPSSPSKKATMEITLHDEHDAKGKLIAWDPVAQKPRWTVHYRSMWNGGTLATAGKLVFQGDEEGMFNAYDAAKGTLLWRFNAQLGIVAAPMSYKVAGIQYVSILVGYGGATSLQSQFSKSGWKYGAQKRRLLTFALNHREKLPQDSPRDYEVYPVLKPAVQIDEAAVVRGNSQYAKVCAFCHGVFLKSNGQPAPDLRESIIAGDVKSLAAFLKSESLQQRGMPPFDFLSDSEVYDLFMYIRAGAEAAAGKRESPNEGDWTMRF